MKNLNQKGVVHIITLLILLAGIAVAVILVQREQIYKSRATNDIYNAFEFSSNEPGKTITCTNNTCESDTLNINIRIRDLNALLE